MANMQEAKETAAEFLKKSLNIEEARARIQQKRKRTFRSTGRYYEHERKGDIKMTNLEEIKETVVEFLRKILDVKDVKIIGATKVDDGWEMEAEVYEESSFIKSLGLPTRVQDRNIYEVKLNDNLEVESYERQAHPVLAD